jgi:YD repeat-containing protein
MLQPRSTAALTNRRRSSSRRRCTSQSTGWTYNTQQLPANVRYTETVTGITSAASTFGFTYDALGNLTQFTQLINGKLETGKLTSYNLNGAFLAGTSTTNQAVKHTYTPRGQLATTSVANQVTTYTYDAIGQSKQITYPNGDKLNYTYDAAHKLQSIKWNGVEQYTPVVGISSNLASLAGYSGISNPELAHKLGVDTTMLDALDAAPKMLTQASNAAAFAAVELAKQAVVGPEARAQQSTSASFGALGGNSFGWGLPGEGMASSGYSPGTNGAMSVPRNSSQKCSVDDICSKGYDFNCSICSKMKSPKAKALCYASAAIVYGACLAGKL